MSTARIGSRTLQALAPEERATCIYTLADLLLSKEKEILEANEKDLAEATKGGLSKPLLSRLSLTAPKLKNLATGNSVYQYVRQNFSSHCEGVLAGRAAVHKSKNLATGNSVYQYVRQNLSSH
jgi:gamma-glutamyl phosphate reductase